MRFSEFAPRGELTVCQNRQRTNRRHENCFVVVMQAGGPKSRDRVAHKVAIVAALVANLAAAVTFMDRSPMFDKFILASPLTPSKE